MIARASENTIRRLLEFANITGGVGRIVIDDQQRILRGKLQVRNGVCRGSPIGREASRIQVAAVELLCKRCYLGLERSGFSMEKH